MPPYQTGLLPTATSPAALVAHTPNDNHIWHELADHLRGTAERARSFADEMGPAAAKLAYYAGLWHDLGKAHPRFQQYLVDQSQAIGKKGEGGDYSVTVDESDLPEGITLSRLVG